MKTSTFVKSAAGMILLVVVADVAAGTEANVNAGHVGVLTQFGAVTGTELHPGFHLKLPLLQDVADFNTQVQLDKSDQLETSSSDLQTVTTQVAVNYHPDPARISDIYQAIGTDYAFKILSPAILESVKAVTARYTASELVQKRAIVKLEIETVLASRVLPYHIAIDAVSITNFRFSDAFNQAIEAKQVAQQHVLTAQQSLDQARIDAQQAVVAAKAGAEAQIATANGNAQAALINARAASQAQTLQARTLSPAYLQYQALLRWNGTLPQYSSVPIPFLQIPTGK